MNISLKYSLMGLAMAGALTACTSEGDDFDYGHKVVYFAGTETNPLVTFAVEDTPSSQSVSVLSSHPVDADVTVKIAIDGSKIDEYNKKYGTTFSMIPESAVTLDADQVVIPAGKSFSDVAALRITSTEDFVDARVYLIPVTMTEVDGSDVLESSRTVFYRVRRTTSFTSLNISNTAMYSNYIFDDSQALELGAYTYEIKIYSEAWHSIARLCAFTSKDEQRQTMLRFGEGGYPVNSLQWVAAPAEGGNMVSNTAFQTNRWYMISCVYDGKRCTLYVDGVKDSEKDADGDPVTFQRLELGMSWTNYPAQQWFRGRIAEVRVWDFARSAADIANTVCSVDPQSEGLRAYWKMNEGDGHIFHDATGNGYDIDWSKTVREITEGKGLEATPSAANAVAWDSDDNNKCTQ